MHIRVSSEEVVAAAELYLRAAGHVEGAGHGSRLCRPDLTPLFVQRWLHGKAVRGIWGNFNVQEEELRRIHPETPYSTLVG